MQIVFSEWDFQDSGQVWIGHAEGMEESAWSRLCKAFKVSSSFPKGWPGKTLNEAIRSDLKKRKAARS